MVGVSESYLGAFAVELGHGPTALALLSTVPFLVGAMSQFFAPRLAIALGGRKRLVVCGAAVQALTHGGLFAIAATDDRRLWPLMAVKTAFWISGSVIAPAWGAWMAALIRGAARRRYFAVRSGMVQGCLLLAFATAGWFLHSAHGRASELRTFSLLFLVALVARAASATALAVKPDIDSGRGDDVGSLSRLRRAARAGDRRVAIYVALLMFGAHIAVPFFTPYMLRNLGLDYGEFAALTSVSVLCKAVAFASLQHALSRVSLRTLLAVGGFGVACVPLFWASADGVSPLVVAQAMGGVSWACVEFASFQLYLAGSPPRLRLEFMAIANALTGAAQVVGGVLGGLLISRAGLTYELIFALSSLGRALPLALLLALPAQLLTAQLPRMLTRLVSVRPVAGGVHRPIAEAQGEELDAERDPPDASRGE
jgi:MFS family permease